MKRRLISLFALLALVVTALVPAGILAESTEGVPCIVYSNRGANSVLPGNQAVHDKILAETGVDLIVRNFEDANYDEKMKMIFASGEKFDVCMRTPLTYTWMDLKARNLIQPINDLVDEYGPVMKEVYGEGLYTSSDPDGLIWAIPRRVQLPVSYTPAIRKDWLDALNMEMPKTVAELEAYFEAVLNTDLNGNGVNDEIPFVPQWNIWGINFTFRTCVLGECGNCYVAEDGQIKPIYAHPQFKAYLELISKWYQKGYIYNEFYTQSGDKINELINANRVGMWAGWFQGNDGYPETVEGMVESPLPPPSDLGASAWAATAQYTDHYVISANAEHPEGFIKYMNWALSSPANLATIYYGTEGVDWEWVDQEKNIIRRVEGATDNYNGFYTLIPEMYFDTILPVVQADNLREQNKNRVQEESKGIVGIPDTQNIWTFNYDGTEAQYLMGDGETLVSEAIMKIIYGEQDLDTWDDVLAQYMAIEGDIYTKVRTEQFKELNMSRPADIVVGE